MISRHFKCFSVIPEAEIGETMSVGIPNRRSSSRRRPSGTVSVKLRQMPTTAARWTTTDVLSLATMAHPFADDLLHDCRRVPALVPPDQLIFAYLEGGGEAQVRRMHPRREFQGQWSEVAIRWLAMKERQSQARFAVAAASQ